jgi:hypothetical protein
MNWSADSHVHGQRWGLLQPERQIVKDQDTLREFIECRTQGWSYVRIASAWGVATKNRPSQSFALQAVRFVLPALDQPWMLDVPCRILAPCPENLTFGVPRCTKVYPGVPPAPFGHRSLATDHRSLPPGSHPLTPPCCQPFYVRCWTFDLVRGPVVLLSCRPAARWPALLARC